MKKTVFVKYSTERQDRFKIKTVILQDENRGQIVEKHAQSPASLQHIRNIAEFEKKLIECTRGTKFRVNKGTLVGDHLELEYLQGERLGDILKGFCKNSAFTEAFAVIREFQAELNKMATDDFVPSPAFEAIFGNVTFKLPQKSCPITDIDMIFPNIIVNSDGWNIIDYEWTFDFPIPATYILYRTMLRGYPELTNLGIYGQLGISDEELALFAQMEHNFQQYVLGDTLPLSLMPSQLKKSLSIENMMNEILAAQEKEKQMNQLLTAHESLLRSHEETVKNCLQLSNQLQDAMLGKQSAELAHQATLTQLHSLIAAHEDLTKHHEFLSQGHTDLTQKYSDLESQYANLADLQAVLAAQYEESQRAVQKLEAENENLQKEQNLILARNNELMAARHSLEAQLQQSRCAYNVISSSFFWKATKPFRKTMDGLKRLFRNCALAHLIWKGMKCLKENGFSYSFGRFCNLFRKEKQLPPAPIAIQSTFYTPGDAITILSTKHTAYIGHLFQESLKQMGVPAQLLIGEPESYGEEVHIVICPQIFTRLPSRYISFQMEQTVSSRWLTDQYYARLSSSYAVFDYSLKNIDYFKSHCEFGKMFYYLPVDFLPGMQHHADSHPYDVVFYGATDSPRRRAMLDALSKEFNVRILAEVFGEELYQELSKAKIIINLHYYENAMLETTRLYEALSLGSSVIVSERSSDPKEEERLEGIVDFVDVDDIDAMKERIAYWLSHESDRQQKVKANTEYLTNRASAFDFFFYRFLLANDWLSFDRFYELAGKFVQFSGERVCLSLPEDVARRTAFDKDNLFGFEVFPGLRHLRGWTGCGLSYKFIMKKAQEQQMDRILVCEDDVFFPDDFESRFARCMKYLEENTDWDIFQGLMADVGKVTVSSVDKSHGQTFVSLDHMISTVFNLYDKSIYPYIIRWDETNEDVHSNTIDRALEAKALKVIATAPFLVGHKEDLCSTIWGFNNSQYNDMIAHSSEKLEKLAAQFEKTHKNRKQKS